MSEDAPLNLASVKIDYDASHPTSFIPLLRKYMALVKPNMVLEYGPGISTKTMLEFPFATLLTIEHHYLFYAKAEAEFAGNPNVTVLYLPDKERYCNFAKDVGTKFDLIFVDGYCDWRVDCMLNSVDILSEKGVLILHDSGRPKYNAGRLPFELIEEKDGTAVFKLKNKTGYVDDDSTRIELTSI